ncbi:MAG TPA: hypothetical protein VHB21_27345, partial [Minicystis sp.]|nr:hypothetical protein [Minicystis sp.]
QPANAPPGPGPRLAPEKHRLDPIDYSGRPSATTAGDVLIWIPRVLFFPVYLVAEYAIRWPLGTMTVFVEQHKLIETLADIFVFGPDKNIGVVPTGLIDFGFRPSVGVYFFYDDFIAKNNALRVHLATGGTDYLRGTVTDRVGIDKNAYLKLRFEGTDRPDFVYYGLGPRALETSRSRYREVSFEETVGLAAQVRDGNGFEVYASVKDARFDANGDCCGDPSLSSMVRAGLSDIPPGFGGYTALRQGLWFSLDSRKPRPQPGTGLRLEGNVEHDFDMRAPGESRWVRWGGSVGGFVDLTGHNRVLSLSLATELADPLGDEPVPFTELASLGGDVDPMHGFLQGRLLDRSSLAATLEYRWPVWSFLDGSAQFAVGNVFGEHYEGFEPDLLRMAFTLGLRSTGSRDHSFNVMIGSGTETFKDGATLNSFRFLFGATRGF